MIYYYTLTQTVLYQDDGRKKRLAYLRDRTMVRCLNIAGQSNLVEVETEIGLSGFVELERIELYTPVMDLYKPVLRWPEDPEIYEAAGAGRAPQFIDLSRLGIRRIHRNLCGEFCVAAWLGLDVIPLLEEWQKKYPRAKTILGNNLGSGAQDLAQLLKLKNWNGTILQFGLISPRRLMEITPAIIGVGINAQGQIRKDGATRHWVVCLEVKPQGDSGWVKIYNPYRNREEVVRYEDVPDSRERLTAIVPVESEEME